MASRVFASIQILGLLIVVNARASAGRAGAPLAQVAGLSEPVILELLLPGYVEPRARSEDPNGEPEWNVTRARITESLLTDFGLGKDRFAVVLVNGTTGDRTQCGFTVVGILDPVKHSVIWRLEPEHYGGHRLEILHLFEGDPRLAFTFRYDAGAHTHNSYVRQAIYQPDWHSDYFEGILEALGWAEDESRFFVVVTFEGERALLSFSVEGTNDYWEELLDPYDDSWRDGFAMRSTRATRSR